VAVEALGSTWVQGDGGQRWRKEKGEGDYPNKPGISDMSADLVRRCCWGL